MSAPIIYLYIDIEGNVGKSDKPPTETDLKMVSDGQLTCLQVTGMDFGIFVEAYDPTDTSDEKWFDVQIASIDEDENGNEYHWVQ